MTFKSKLYNILNDINKYKGLRTQLMQMSIQERLDKSFNNYTKSLDDSYEYLSYRSSLRVMKKLNRKD